MLADDDVCKAELDILDRQPKLIKRSVQHG